MKKLVIALAAVVAVALPANASAAQQVHGIVVSKQKAGHVLVVAAGNGTAWTVNTRPTSARVGSVVTVSAKRQPDGTFAASRVRTTGRASHARVRGVVIKKVAGTTFLAAGRSVLAVRSKGRSLMSAENGPAPGTVATVGLAISPGGSLTATSMTQTGQSSQIVIQATVAAVTPATATTPGSLTLTISGQQLVVPLPAGTVLAPNVVVGATVMLTIKLEPTAAVAPDEEDEDEDDEDEAEEDDEDEDEDEDEDD